MSTAGKVLVCFGDADVTGLDGPVRRCLSAQHQRKQKLHDLADQVEKLQDDLETDPKRHRRAQEFRRPRSKSSSTARSPCSAPVSLTIEKDRSQIRESLARWQYQLATVQETIERAKAALQHRNEEHQSGEQVLAKSKSDVKELMDRSGELMNQLMALRKEFQTTYHANVESLGKTR